MNIKVEWTSYGKEGHVAGSDERLKSIEGFDGYFITDHGRVFSCKHRVGFGKYVVDYDAPWELKAVWYKGNDKRRIPYKTVRLTGNKARSIHRLVAEAFIENPDPELYPIVNHLTHHHNNHYKHLEWTDTQGNNDHARGAVGHLLINPSGEEVVVRNFQQFCNEQGLHHSTMYSRRKSKGWIYLGDPKNPLPMPAPTNQTKVRNNPGQPKEHILIDPNGNRLIISNLQKFCKDNALHHSTLYCKGKTKGWIYKGRVDQQVP